MKTVMNIPFGIVTLWTVVSITASQQTNPDRSAYNFPSSTLDLKPQTNETTSGSDGEISSIAVLSVSTSVTSAPTASPSETNSVSSQSSSVSPVALNAQEIQKLGQILEQDKADSIPSKAPPAIERATASTKAETSTYETTVTNATNGNSTESMSTNGTSSFTTSVPKVVLPTEESKTYIEYFYKTSLAWLGDQYTLSIVVPILAGFLFAIVIIVTLATFTCIRRRCRRRRLRKKILPETIRKMGPSDRARLLAETSDEEF